MALVYIFIKREDPFVYYNYLDPLQRVGVPDQFVIEDSNVDFLIDNVALYVPKPLEPQNNTSVTQEATPGQPPLMMGPHDPRLIFISDSKNSTLLSFSAEAVEPLVEGFVLPEDPNQSDSQKVSAQNIKDLSAYSELKEFGGVPSIMNPNAYISFQQFTATKDANAMSLLMDQENQPRWYEVDQYNAERGHRYKSPTVTQLVEWSQEEKNRDRMPYRFQDFAYCKWWQLIPNNYLVTLRRYPFPTADNLEADGEKNPKGDNPFDTTKLRPVATAVTWLGEDTGNKISTILGPIETGLNWKDLKSEMNVVSPAEPGDAGAGPVPGVAKWLGLISGDYRGGDEQQAQRGAPPDPYTDGPWQNKIIGPINVIDSVKMRERGLKFDHKITLVFEYSARSIGGINAKAAMLDIMSNLLLLTSASATFWGGANRFRPGAPGNAAPFLGGKAGRAAWLRGDPGAFMNSVASQFSKAASAVSDFLFSAVQNPIDAIKSLAAGMGSNYMKSTVTSQPGFVTGIKAILTGEPVGEWHLMVGNPFNPMMMIGNLICENAKIEFNDELGPDDFPTEIKATITLAHGRPRDRDAIESMFNAGGGRLYSLPPGYEQNISSASMTKVDAYTGKNKGSGGEGNTGTRKPGGKFYRRSALLGDPAAVDNAINTVTQTATKTYSSTAAKWGLGYNKKA